MSLKEQVMIINLSISQWSARKYDQTATREVEQAHDAKEAGRFNKVLMQSETLKKIGQVASKIRTYHYENTLPWGDNGDRILPTEKYFDYISQIGMLKYEFTELVDAFVEEYTEEKERSKKRLNTLYHETDYPQPESLRKKFDVAVGIMPIAESNDLRVNMSDSVVNDIRQRIEKELGNRVESAVQDMLERLRNVVGKMVETLIDPDKVFRDSLIGNIESVVEVLPTLNFNNDQRVTDAVNMCRSLVVDPDKLRNNSKFRKEMADKSAKILEVL